MWLWVTAAVSDSSSESSIDYEGVPALGVGQKRNLKVCTYEELHGYILDMIKILEEVYELGIMKGTVKQYKKVKPDNDQECPWPMNLLVLFQTVQDSS